MDEAHKDADKKLKRLERRLETEYNKAAREMNRKAAKMLRDYNKELKAKTKLLKSGLITESEFDNWLLSKAAQKQWLDNMAEVLANHATHVNEIAAGMINEELPGIYANNFNYGTYEVENGTHLDTSFTLYDPDTVQTVAEGYFKPDINIPKDIRWNARHFDSALLQGILQGEAIPKIAKRLSSAVGMNHRSAVRMARTAVTGAENAGRINSYRRAQGLGIEVQKQWIATLDTRTRKSHRALDEMIIPVEETFPNGLKYPAEEGGAPAEIYNCRCTLIAAIPEIADEPAGRFSRLPEGLTYDEWKAGKNPPKVPKVKTKKDVDNVVKNVDKFRHPVLMDAMSPEEIEKLDKVLEKVTRPDILDAYKKYSNDLGVTSTKSKGGWFSYKDGGISLNLKETIRGTNYEPPFEVLFHEFGHNLDYLLGGKSPQLYASGQAGLKKVIKQDWLNYIVRFREDNFTNAVESIYKNDLNDVVRSFYFSRWASGKTIEKFYSQYRGDPEAIIEAVLGNKTTAKKFNEWFTVAHIKNIRGLEIIDVLDVSDVIEGATGISYPLGGGHGAKYHKLPGKSDTEFFAEYCSAAVTNENSYNLMREMFPESSNIVDEIIRKALEGGNR